MLSKLYVRECKNKLCKKIFKTYQKNQVYCCPKCRTPKNETVKERISCSFYRQLCWRCKNATGGCSWSRCLKPIEGWKAKKITIKDSMGDFTSYRITYCPEFVQDRR